MAIQVFVFNYGFFDKAMKIYKDYNSIGYKTYLLNCQSPKDPSFESTDTIIKLPNIYYAGQWNTMIDILSEDITFIISSDIQVQNPRSLMKKMERFYNKFEEKGAVYAPNVWWTPWTYNPNKLKDVGDGCKIVVNPDSMIWSLRSDLVKKVGKIDTKINWIGWGIELLACWYATRSNRLVVRDYSIKVSHPQSSNYDRGRADRQFRSMVDRMDKSAKEDFWKYYNSRSEYQFGWRGADDPSMFANPTKFL